MSVSTFDAYFAPFTVRKHGRGSSVTKDYRSSTCAGNKELTIPNITVGCKLSHGDISLHTQIASNPRIDPNYFALFTGLGQQLLPVLTVGGAGAIDGLAAFFPRVVVRLWEATLQGVLDEARSIQVSIWTYL